MEWLIGIPLGIFLGKQIFGDDDKKPNNNQDNNYNRQLSREIDNLRIEKERMERINRDNNDRINELMRMMKENKEEEKRNKLQREIEIREEENLRELQNIEEMNKRQKAIEKCKNLLSNEFKQTIWNTITNFISERDKWLERLLSDENVNNKLDYLKNELSILFNKLFNNQKISDKINNIFINLLENNVNIKELNKMNFMVIGTSGVGKSTLINQLLGEKLAEEGVGKRCTTKIKRYESKNLPFISLTDTVGTEIGQEHNLEDVEKETLNEIVEKLNNNDPNEHIHGIIYCITSNRFFKDELKLLIKIREKYDGNKLPIVIAYTKATNNKEAEAIKNTINEFLNEFREKIIDDDDDDDNTGINFIKVMARENIYERLGQEFSDPCFGLSKLISTCYKKAKKIYQIPMKKSLIQIGKNKITEYVNKISINIQNNINFYLFLQHNFPHNFYEYIAYSFVKITNIENLYEINFSELNNLYNYLQIINSETKNDNINVNNKNNMINENNYNSQNNYYNETNENNYIYNNNYYNEINNVNNYNYENNNYNEIKENNYNNKYNSIDNIYYDNKNKELNKKIYAGEKLCIYCKKKPIKSYVCEFCGLFICENCYLKKFEIEDKVICECNCDNFKFCEEEQDTNNNILNEKNIIFEDNYNYNNNNDNNFNINNDNNINNFNFNNDDYNNFNFNNDNNYNNLIFNNDNNYNNFNNINNNNNNFNFNNDNIYNNFNNNNNNEDNDKSILKTNINLESKKAINEYIKKFRNEIINILGQKFDEFAKEASKEIYYQISDKYLEIIKNENVNMNMNDAMKSPQQLQLEATNCIKKELKESSEEIFLTKNACSFYRDIITIFEKEMINKIDDYINNLDNNENFLNFIQTYGILKEGKNPKIDDDFNDYIKTLKKNEYESMQKSANLQYGGGSSLSSSKKDNFSTPFN